MTDPVQQQLIQARRDQILDAAANVFAEKGFHPATIRDIATAAGIADGTIYNYFKNKPALLLGIFDRMRESIQQESGLGPVAGNDLRSFLNTYLTQPLIALRADNFDLFRVVVSEMMVNQELRALYRQQILEPANILAEAQLQQWVAQGVVKSMDVQLAARTITGLVIGLILQHITEDAFLAEHWEQLPEFLTGLLLDGLAVDPA